MQIIKVKYIKVGKPVGRPYIYYSEQPVKMGDVVFIHNMARGIVVNVDVPEREITSCKKGIRSIEGLDTTYREKGTLLSKVV